MMILMPSLCSCSIAPGVDSLIGSATAIMPAARLSIATKIAVCPCCCSSAAFASSFSKSTMPRERRNCGLPTSTRRPFTWPVTPPPVVDSKSVTTGGFTPRSLAPFTIAAASGCSLFCSTDAAAASSSCSETESAGTMVVRRGRPSVSVPVLSTTSVRLFPSAPSLQLFLSARRLARRVPLQPLPTSASRDQARRGRR